MDVKELRKRHQDLLLELVKQPVTLSWAAIPTASRSHARRRSTDGEGGCVAVGTVASPFKPIKIIVSSASTGVISSGSACQS